MRAYKNTVYRQQCTGFRVDSGGDAAAVCVHGTGVRRHGKMDTAVRNNDGDDYNVHRVSWIARFGDNNAACGLALIITYSCDGSGTEWGTMSDEYDEHALKVGSFGMGDTGGTAVEHNDGGDNEQGGGRGGLAILTLD